MWTNGKKVIRVKYINSKPNMDFDYGTVYCAYYPVDIDDGSLYAIKDRYDEWYAYPASWFEVVDEDKPSESNEMQWH